MSNSFEPGSINAHTGISHSAIAPRPLSGYSVIPIAVVSTYPPFDWSHRTNASMFASSIITFGDRQCRLCWWRFPIFVIFQADVNKDSPSKTGLTTRFGNIIESCRTVKRTLEYSGPLSRVCILLWYRTLQMSAEYYKRGASIHTRLPHHTIFTTCTNDSIPCSKQ